MANDLSTLAPEEFLRLAVARGGLDLDLVIQRLDPQVALALRQIALPMSPPDRSLTRSAPTRSVGLGHQAAQNVKPVEEPAPTITLDDLVDQGRLTPEQAQQAQDTIFFHQSHYTAGTRYSVFGPEFLAVEALICLECGQVASPQDIHCTHCNTRLGFPMGADNSGYLKAIDLLQGSQLTQEKILALLDSLRQQYSFYMAGTKYSVFGEI